MNLDAIKAHISRQPELSARIGMELISTPEADSCCAIMHVDERNRQPFGYLSGGAILAMAETLAGAGSYALCPDKIAVGQNVSANHVHPAAEGDTVTAKARIMHEGNSTHLWDVEVRNTAGELISHISVTNFIITPNKK